jgi:hypothetical protein
LIINKLQKFQEIIDFMGVHLRGRKPPAEKWAFLSRRLIFRVGGKTKK